MDRWASGERYESYVGRWSRLVAREFLAWLDPAPGLHWLDAGCGTGALTAAVLAQTAPAEVLGIDPSPGFVDWAAAKVHDPRASFVVGDARALPVCDGSVEAVVSALMLNFVPDRVGALREMSRALRPGGRVAGYVWDYPGEMELLARFWDAAVDLDDDAHPLHEGVRFGFCRPEPLRRMFAGAGLADVEVRPLTVPTVFGDFDDLWAPFLGGQGPAPSYVATLDEDRRAALRDSLRDRLPPAEGGTIRLTARAWAVRGTRP